MAVITRLSTIALLGICLVRPSLPCADIPFQRPSSSSQIVSIIGMSIAAKNKHGSEYVESPTGSVAISDILAAFSLLGNILTIILSALGIVICIIEFLFHPVLLTVVRSPHDPS